MTDVIIQAAIMIPAIILFGGLAYTAHQANKE